MVILKRTAPISPARFPVQVDCGPGCETISIPRQNWVNKNGLFFFSLLRLCGHNKCSRHGRVGFAFYIRIFVPVTQT